MRPLIGITTYAEVVSHGRWTEHVAFAPSTYSNVLFRAGANSVLLPPWPEPMEAESLISRLDGVVLSGGEDICGLEYGREEEDAEHETEIHNPLRDGFEIAVARQAWDSRVPILAICRGIQVLNVALGGTLVPDLAAAGADERHRLVPGEFNPHEVDFEPGSRMHSLFGDRTDVPSHHHQALDRVSDDLVISGRAPDGMIEAAESADPDRFALGVQWHPEEGTDPTLFNALVEECGGVPSLR